EQMYGDVGEVPEGEYIIPLGVADIKKAGDHVSLVTFGKITKVALEAANKLSEEGIEVEVIDLRSIRPLDINTVLESVKKTNRLVILEESWPFASIATEIIAQVQETIFDYLDAPIRRINTKDVPMAYAPTLVEEFLPDAAEVAQAVKDVLYVK
ncbi:MAG: transketolase C-terminal domain-containing protein, partial [Flavobacteriales bacterium]